MRRPISVEADTYPALLDAAKRAGDSFGDVEQIESLIYYDGTLVDIVKDAADGIWLRIVVDEDNPRSDALRRVVVTTNLLAFEDVESAKATLHDGEAPTITSYEKASEIVEQVTSYDAIIGGTSSRHRYQSRAVKLEDVPEDHLPFRQMMPGRTMRFGPLADFLQLGKEESSGLYRYPVPEDEIVVFHDCVRNWIGRFQGDEISPRIHFVACISDDEGRWVQHRLSFALEDETAFRATLAAGQAPTMATYRLAKEIRRETITGGTDDGMLTVDDLDPDSLVDEAPTYQDVAEHDREWPDFAAKDKD